MDFKQHVETAWNLTLGHIVALILSTLVMVAVSALTLGILGPVTLAGYTQSLLLLVRDGREPRVQDLFGHMNLFVPLLLFGLALLVASSIGFALLLLPGVAVLVAAAFACLYMLPLMTDRQLGLVEAIKQSYALAREGDLVDHLILVVLYLAISAIGGSVFFGVLFTQPLATLLVLSTYEEKLAATPPAPPQA